MEGKGLDFKEIFSDVCGENEAAKQYCEALVVWASAIDNFADGDGRFHMEQILVAHLNALLTFAFNPFFQEHKGELMPLIFSGVRAWLDSNHWQGRESFRDRASADVLKSQYQEAIWYVAKILGGWEKYSEITGKWRSYHYDVCDDVRPARREPPHQPGLIGGTEALSGAATIKQFEEICLGDRDAIQFCWLFFRWVHWLDDTIDADKPWTAEEAGRLNLEALMVFASNPFFQRHKERLTPLIIAACRAYGDSEAWKDRRSDVKDRRAADVLKSFYNEVFWHAGYLVAREQGKDGWQHLSAMTNTHRAFDYDCKE